MDNKKNSKPLIILVCILILLGLILLGVGIGKLINKECESMIISIGLGFLVIAGFLRRNFIRDES